MSKSEIQIHVVDIDKNKLSYTTTWEISAIWLA